MIVRLRGKVLEKRPDYVVVETGGVGYGVFATHSLEGKLKVNDETSLYIHQHIRETSHELFGFDSEQELFVFEKLLTVSGIGPKMAMAVLNIGSLSQVASAIASGDTAFVQQASGVGKRVAERIIIELRDKLGGDADSVSLPDTMNVHDEALQALVTLGYSNHDAVKALSKIDKSLSTEERVRKALQGATL